MHTTFRLEYAEFTDKVDVWSFQGEKNVCSRMVSNSCSNSGTHRVTVKRHDQHKLLIVLALLLNIPIVSVKEVLSWLDIL